MKLLSALIVTVCLFWSSLSSQTVVADTISNEDNLNYWFSILPTGKWASSFESSSSVVLTSLQLSLVHISGSNSLEVGVFNDASGTVGSLIEATTITVTQTDYSVLTNVNLSGKKTLSEGVTYWIGVAIPVGVVGNILWGGDGSIDAGYISETFGETVEGLSSPWQPDNWSGPSPGFMVYGNANPEPPPYTLDEFLELLVDAGILNEGQANSLANHAENNLIALANHLMALAKAGILTESDALLILDLASVGVE